MTDYGHDLLFGTFVTPSAQQPDRVVALTRLAERAGLDLATFQDHPYQPALLDAWTLLSYLAAATSRIRLTANVLNLPLRQPVVLARGAASLDLLSGGRVELGLGAGAFWDAIEASGGRRLTAGQAVDALDEAITVIREVWAADRRGGVRVDGRYYRVVGAKRGPAPAHDIGIWVGAYKPRMLRLVGRAADGWLPSLPYLKRGPAELTELNARIDEGAAEAGRDPAAVRRLLNIAGRFDPAGTELLAGPPARWVEELAAIALEHGISGFVLMADDPTTIQRYGEEVAPAVRELVAAERSGGATRTREAAPVAVSGGPAGPPEAGESGAGELGPGELGPGELGITPTPAPAVRLSDRTPWDESARPAAPAPPGGQRYTDRGRAIGRHLIEVHDHLRAELTRLRDLLRQVRAGAVSAADARSALHGMTLRRNDWTLGAYCASYCALVTQHHGLEDRAVFPHLRRVDAGLAPVIDRLADEHAVIHEVVEGVDRALVDLLAGPGDFTAVQEAIDLLTDALLSHLAYEERQIVEPLARHGFYAGQF
jgi:alkanesulfonate monooxygenase SsuD/methylene tetrahydromethanopterin reductase-like flavin-dependent oxidoreductase (luciferase family)